MRAVEPLHRHRARLTSLSICVALFSTALPAAAADDTASAVVLLYHHVGDRTPPSTSISPRNFDLHLDYLAREGYTVLPLADLVRAMANGEALPARAVALTFDDAYSSVYSEALPRLERRGWPFTLFVATDPVDGGYPGFMSWDELRDLQTRGGTVANHGRSHAHLIRREPDESAAGWRARVSGDIVGAQARLDAELARTPRYFAYPYGEFDVPLETLVAELDFIAFGQQSGPIGPGSDPRYLPRFPMATGFDSVESLAEKLRTRPLPVTVLKPSSRLLPPASDAPALQLRFADGQYRREGLRCYVAGQDPAIVDWDGDVATIRARERLGAGRSKYNCTAPSTDESGVFYWYSYLWIQPRDDGSWYPD